MRRSAQLQNNSEKQLTNIMIAVFDLYDVVSSSSTNGFMEATRGCCGTGRIELTPVLCNPKSIGTCSNATQYVFWEAANKFLLIF